MSLLFTDQEAKEKQHKTIITRTDLGIVPPGTIGTVSGTTQVGSEFLLIVHWLLPEPVTSNIINKEDYEKQFELPLSPEDTVEAMYLSLDLQRHFRDDELKTISGRLITISTPPEELKGILRLHPTIHNRPDILSVGCDLAIALDRDTESRWTERMTDTLAKKLTLPEIAELYQEFSGQDEAMGIAAENRIVRNACDLILRSHKTS